MSNASHRGFCGLDEIVCLVSVDLSLRCSKLTTRDETFSSSLTIIITYYPSKCVFCSLGVGRWYKQLWQVSRWLRW